MLIKDWVTGPFSEAFDQLIHLKARETTITPSGLANIRVQISSLQSSVDSQVEFVSQVNIFRDKYILGTKVKVAQSLRKVRNPNNKRKSHFKKKQEYLSGVYLICYRWIQILCLFDFWKLFKLQLTKGCTLGFVILTHILGKKYFTYVCKTTKADSCFYNLILVYSRVHLSKSKARATWKAQ